MCPPWLVASATGDVVRGEPEGGERRDAEAMWGRAQRSSKARRGAYGGGPARGSAGRVRAGESASPHGRVPGSRCDSDDTGPNSGSASPSPAASLEPLPLQRDVGDGCTSCSPRSCLAATRRMRHGPYAAAPWEERPCGPPSGARPGARRRLLHLPGGEKEEEEAGGSLKQRRRSMRCEAKGKGEKKKTKSRKRKEKWRVPPLEGGMEGLQEWKLGGGIWSGIVRHGCPWVPTDQAHVSPRQVSLAY
jgi:hypothetical protein